MFVGICVIIDATVLHVSPVGYFTSLIVIPNLLSVYYSRFCLCERLSSKHCYLNTVAGFRVV